jgi:hypothetical protein
MHLKGLLLFVAAGFGIAHAAAVPAVNATLVLLDETAYEDGTLQVWGGKESGWNAAPSGKTAQAAAQAGVQASTQACGTNDVHCSEYNQTGYSACKELIDKIRGSPDQPIHPDGVALYWVNKQGSICQIAWYKKVSGLKYAYVIPAAWKTLNRCSSSGLVSGYATNVNLYGVCNVQCLSSRASCFNNQD